MSGPLAGIRVIDITINVLGPVSTQILGDMGADVIKVETPDGDPMRQLGSANAPGMAAMYMSLNRNKRSVVLDLRRPTGLEALMRLVETADVFVHSLRPGSADRLGVSYAAVSARNRRISQGKVSSGTSCRLWASCEMPAATHSCVLLCVPASSSTRKT